MSFSSAGYQLLPVLPELQVDANDSTELVGYRAMYELIGRGVTFDAVFAASDLLAIGAMRALSVAMPVFAYICRYSLEISTKASRDLSVWTHRERFQISPNP